jgi:hypothetical protein
MKLSIGYLPNSDLAEKLLEHFLIPGTVPSLNPGRPVMPWQKLT